MAGPLVDVGSLASELTGASPPVVLDVRWRLAGPPGIDLHNEGHLPGAVFADLDADLAGPPGAAGRHPLPPAADFEAVMRRAGVRPGRPVVAYDDGDSTVAARAWWLLRYFGHDQARVLDGGLRAWASAGLPVETGSPQAPMARPGAPMARPDAGVARPDAGVARPDAGVARPPQTGAGLGSRERAFAARPGHLPVLDHAGAAALARSGVLLDARAAVRYRGESEPVDPVGGHIPGAVSAPTSANVTADGLLLSPAQLRERFAALGIHPGEEVGVYCGSGVTAAHEVLALELAGFPAALYVGSWSGWIADPDRPVATGPDPG